MTTRRPYSSQSTLYILLDYADEQKLEDMEIMYKALEETIVLAGSVVGGTRLPGIGVGALGPPFSTLLKLTTVKTNLPSVLTALGRMFDGLTPTPEGIELSMEVGAALDSIIAEADGFSPALSHPLQLLVLTWRPVQLFTDVFTSILAHSHAKYLRAVHVVGILSVLDPQPEDDLPAGDAAGGVWVTGATYTADFYTFAALFKSWLIESKGTDPHVQLIFPPNLPDKEEPMSLSLDIQEIMVDPASLPNVVGSKLFVQNNNYRKVSATQGNSVPFVELEVIKRVSSSSLAAALIGPSNYLVPTGATSLSFDHMWENKQYVACLSHKLEEKGEALFAQVITPPGAIAAQVAIFPASHCSALTMIHVAPAELLLSERNLEASSSQGELPNKVTSDIETRLSQLETSGLKLEDHSTNLISSLMQHFAKPAKCGTARVAPTPVGTPVHRGVHHSRIPGRTWSGHTTSFIQTHQHPAFQGQDPVQTPRGRSRGTLGQRSIAAFRRNSGRPFR